MSLGTGCLSAFHPPPHFKIKDSSPDEVAFPFFFFFFLLQVVLEWVFKSFLHLEGGENTADRHLRHERAAPVMIMNTVSGKCGLEHAHTRARVKCTESFRRFGTFLHGVGAGGGGIIAAIIPPRQWSVASQKKLKNIFHKKITELLY